MTQKERMLSGKLYHAGKDESLAAEYRRGQKLMAELNRLPFDAPDRKDF